MCNDCRHVFKSRQSKWHHRKYHCRGAKGANSNDNEDTDNQEGLLPNPPPIHNNDTMAMDSKDQEIIRLKQHIHTLEQRVIATNGINIQAGTIINNTTSHHTNNTRNQTNNQTIVNINAFGHESLNHITPQFLDRCVLRRDKGLVELIGKIHFDPKHAENNNIKATNKRSNVVSVHNGTAWRYDRKDRVLDRLVDEGHGMMQEHFEDNEDRIREAHSETMFEVIRKWMDKMQERDKKTVDSVLTDIYILLLNAGLEVEIV
jgi:hypothetical protein